MVDLSHLVDLTTNTEMGSSQLDYLVKAREKKQANTIRLLKEDLENLSKQQQEVKLKQLEISEDYKPLKSISDDVIVQDKRPELDAEQRTTHLEKLFETSIERESWRKV